MRIVPLYGTWPSSASSSVVLPAPLGPMMAVALASGTSAVTESRIEIPPRRTDTLSNVMPGILFSRD